MAYRYGDRDQLSLFPPSVEDYVPKDAAVRAYDAMVEALDFDSLGIKIDPNVDGSKIRANASIKNEWTKERCNEALKRADEAIDRILKECEDEELYL